MKQETKELIDGLKDWYEKFRSETPLTPYTEWAVGDGKGYADEGASNMDKVIALLDSLENLENQLKHGGFIPDRNGKPCKDGDRIKICLNGRRQDEIVYGTLCWNYETYGFYAIEETEVEHLYIDSNSGVVQWFEKEEA